MKHVKQVVCVACGYLRPVEARDAEGKPLCFSCAKTIYGDAALAKAQADLTLPKGAR